MAEKGKNTKFAEQSAAENPQALAVAGMFAVPDGFNMPEEKDLERRNFPTLVKPGEVPVGGILIGEIIKIVDSPVSTVKGKLLWLRLPTGQEITFPCTGVIRNALAPGVTGDGAELTKALEKEIGKTIFCKRNPDKTSDKYKKSMFMFDVRTTKK